MKIKRIDGELWYPAVSEYGMDMPYGDDYEGTLSLKNNGTANQMVPLLLSNKGRLIYGRGGFEAAFQREEIEIIGDADFVCGLKSLRGAFEYYTENYCSLPMDIPAEFIKMPIYNTWMHAPFNVTQKKVLEYAEAILDLGMPAGIIIIDDKWSKEYGDWEFDDEKFENPVEMISKLHEMGFLVMLWVCPYVSFESEAFKTGIKEGWLLADEPDEAYRLEWWNETSACIDLRNKKGTGFLKNAFDKLCALGADGFKFDGGDSRYYREEDNPDLQSRLWAELASDYRFNEVRADFDTGAFSIFERLSDKRHSWGRNGISSMLPSAFALGLGAHPVFALDMIGGGEVKDISENTALKEEIFLAHCQLGALMPNMQFSILPDKVLKGGMSTLLKLMDLRGEYSEYMEELWREAMEKGTPIIRLLEFEFPDENFGHILDRFMFGSRYLIVPVTREGEDKKSITLPTGTWKYKDRIYKGRSSIIIDMSLDELVVLEKTDD